MGVTKEWDEDEDLDCEIYYKHGKIVSKTGWLKLQICLYIPTGIARSVTVKSNHEIYLYRNSQDLRSIFRRIAFGIPPIPGKFLKTIGRVEKESRNG